MPRRAETQAPSPSTFSLAPRPIPMSRFASRSWARWRGRRASAGKCSSLGLCDLSFEEVADQRHHFVSLVLQGEMAGVDEVKLDLRKVALVRMRPVRRENLVVLAPHDQRGRLVLAEVRLSGRIKRQVGAIVIEDVHLNVSVARTIQQRLIVNPVVRRDPAEVTDAVGVLELSRLWSDQHVQGLAMGLRVVGPIRLDGVPELLEPFFI